MTAFRAWLGVIFVSIAVYTAIVMANHGANLFPQFFGDMAKLGWPGQFNVDFMCLLTLSGLWVAWRHRFSGAGLALGLCALFGGALFLSSYLLFAARRADGDPARLLLGQRAMTPRGV